jgi:predicted dehydrogenase
MVQVCGTKGEAYYTSGKGTFVLVHQEPELKRPLACEGALTKDSFVEVKAGKWGGHERCIAEWVKMIRGEKHEVITSGREVRGTVEVAEAAALSDETDRTVTLPITPRPWK